MQLGHRPLSWGRCVADRDRWTVLLLLFAAASIVVAVFFPCPEGISDMLQDASESKPTHS